MVESLNTKIDFAIEAISYVGFPKYGKCMIGDKAFEFFNDKNVSDNMQFPYPSIKRIEGEVFSKERIGKNFYIVLQNENKVRFSTQDTGKILKIFRQYLGDGKVVRSKTFTGTFLNLFKKRKK